MTITNSFKNQLRSIRLISRVVKFIYESTVIEVQNIIVSFL